MGILKELNQMNEVSPTDSLAALDKREKKKMEEVETKASSLADRSAKQARALFTKALQAEAKARLLDQVSNLAGNLAIDPTFLETTKEDLAVGDVSQVRTETLIQDLAEFERDGAIEFVNDDGAYQTVVSLDEEDARKVFVAALAKVKIP